MRFTVVTLFPDLFGSFLDASLLGKARAAGVVTVDFVDPRAFTTDKHRSVDDAPYGGGPGMVMMAPPLLAAIEAAGPGHRVLMTPAGAPLTQRRVRELAARDHVVLVCGRYEGIDERVTELAIDESISIGDFVLTGGEPAAMAVIDAVSRYVPGVLGEAASVDDESFSDGLLEYPQYTRPAAVRGLGVPDVLQGGNHGAIAAWRQAQSLARTADVRPDLLAGSGLAAELAARTYLCLVHHPVLDRDGAVVTTAITNLDVHDIARTAATFGLAGYFVVTPIEPQRELVGRIVANWQSGPRFEARGRALDRVRAAASIQEVTAAIARAHKGRAPRVVATTARRRDGAVSSADLIAAAAAEPKRPVVVLLGTGHGLAEAALAGADTVLQPIGFPEQFNHLSVRGAAAILVDRLFGRARDSAVAQGQKML